MITLPSWSTILVYSLGSMYTPPLAIAAYAALSSIFFTPKVSPPRAVDCWISENTLPLITVPSVIVVNPKFLR